MAELLLTFASSPPLPLTHLIPASLCPSLGQWRLPWVAQGPSSTPLGWCNSSCACPWFSGGTQRTLGWQHIRFHLFCLRQHGPGCQEGLTSETTRPDPFPEV